MSESNESIGLTMEFVHKYVIPEPDPENTRFSLSLVASVEHPGYSQKGNIQEILGRVLDIVRHQGENGHALDSWRWSKINKESEE